MKRTFLFTLCFILFCGSLFSQNCPSNDYITFLTQEEVDNFATDYPGCTEIGYVYIGTNSDTTTITNLDGLSQLTSVSSIDIRNNPNLQNIAGLQNISGELTRLFIFDNDVLVNLFGLEGITEVSDQFFIGDNDALSNLAGLDNLEALTTYNPSSIANNDMLSDLSGLSSLNYIRVIYIQNNNNLANLNGLENVNTIQTLRIKDNDGLTSLEGFGTDNIDFLEITNNDALTSLVGLENITNTSSSGLDIEIEDNDALTSLNGLNSLDSVNVLTISSSPLLTNLEDIGQLVFANRLNINDNDMLTNLSDLGNISINNLTISRNDGLTDLSGLENITELQSLTMSSNDGLTDLSGLENITELQSLVIRDNVNLVNLSGLENLTRVGDSNFGFWIFNNDALTDISALSNLSHVGSQLFISGNLVLPNLTGLENFKASPFRSNSLTITNNAALSDISGLNILSSYWHINSMSIVDNPSLSTCSQQGICYYLSTGRNANINNNAPGCNSNDEVLNTCNIVDSVCPVGDITFTSQSQLDSFAINHFNCNRIFGNLTVSSPSITNVDALFMIDSIDGDFNICDNPNLTDLRGLSPMRIGGDFWFKNNDAVTDLGNDFDFNGGMYILDNDALRGIGNMTATIYNVTYVQITNNPNLDFCSIFPLSQFNISQSNNGFTAICSFLSSGGPHEIHDNAPGCNSGPEIVGLCNSAPVTLTYFQAKIDHKTTLLTWQTATESNNAGFEIQRSTDGINWDKIAWQDGQGTTTTAHTYTHRDENPLFGTSYYRLKQVDFDGAFEYSHIVQVNYRGRDISIYPNPVKNTLHIADLNGENIQHISIYDQTGREIYASQMPGNTIDVSALSPGMYILKIAVKGEVICRKFIVQEMK